MLNLRNYRRKGLGCQDGWRGGAAVVDTHSWHPQPAHSVVRQASHHGHNRPSHAPSSVTALAACHPAAVVSRVASRVAQT